MDVGAWLRGLGLGQYEQAFRDNDVDADLLARLTAEDLREIGVASVGHRRRLLDAVAALRAATTHPPPAAGISEPTPEPRASEPSQAGAERWQLTVVFVDLVGSTQLATRLDPEEMAGLLRAYQNVVTGEVTRFEGYVAKYLGDGVLAYFGWPRAHEDAAERAVRAGLAVVRSVAELRTPSGGRLKARIGIATGLVVVGELIGEGAAYEEAVVGETPNLAARLQQAASPGGILLAEGTRRLLGGSFEFEDTGPLSLAGFAEPIRAFQVTGEGWAEGRFEARQTGEAAPLVGREQELALLLDRWQLAKSGEGQVVLLSGEPGIGKSRLVLALRQELRAQPHLSLRYHCSPYHGSSALWPVADQLERAASFARSDAPEDKLAKLDGLLAQAVPNVSGLLPLFAELLAIPAEGHLPALDLTPEQRRARTFSALLAQLEGLASREPVLLVLEDAHWSDPTTQELFGLVVDRVRDLAVLAFITFRPEFAAPWAGHAQVTSLGLTRLSTRHAAALVRRMAGKDIPEDVVERIVARTDGVPLFAEELTKAVLEAGPREDASGGGSAGGRPRHRVVPATLHDVLVARLDRGGSVREVAQVAAAIGREFSPELLAAVAQLPEDKLREGLNGLVASGLVVQAGTIRGWRTSIRRSISSGRLGSVGGRPSCTGCVANCCSPGTPAGALRRFASAMPWTSPAASTRARSSCVQA